MTPELLRNYSSTQPAEGGPQALEAAERDADLKNDLRVQSCISWRPLEVACPRSCDSRSQATLGSNKEHGPRFGMIDAGVPFFGLGLEDGLVATFWPSTVRFGLRDSLTPWIIQASRA